MQSDKDYDLLLRGIRDGSNAFTGPEIVQIDLTNNCNLNCVGCWCHSDLLDDVKLTGAEKEIRLAFSNVKNLINDLAKMGTSEVWLSGSGESFIYPEIMDVIRLIKKKGMKCQIITNFTLVNEKILKELVDLKVDNITVSLWAGTSEKYLLTHPNQTDKVFNKMGKMLKYLHSIKKDDNLPHVKIYNVISNLNYDNIKEMVEFAIDTKVDFVEFQVIDTIRGKTESLKVSKEHKQPIKDQFEELRNRKEYTDALIGTKDLESFNKKVHRTELMEFGRFLKETLPEGFRLDLENERVICPCDVSSIQMEVDQEKRNAFIFKFPQDECENCKDYADCPIREENHQVKQEFLNLLGFGSFYRRISAETPINKSDRLVDSIPCYAGWIYCRIMANGDVIPCCKAHLMPLGNINIDSFKDVWNSQKYDCFRHKAKNLKKSDPYFEKIECYKGCDNYGMNLDTHRRVLSSKPRSLFSKLTSLWKR